MPSKNLTVSRSGEKTIGRFLDHAGDARPQRIGFVSLGCPKNLVDSEVMMGLLARAGAELSPQVEDADVIVVNTCSFIESAQQESVNTILEMAGHKTSGSGGVPGRAVSR
jgi:ribosomal protein S12 methylthiotransferase